MSSSPSAARRASGWSGLLLASTIALAAGQVAQAFGGPQLLFALAIGMAFNFTASDPRLAPGLEMASKRLLRLGVALLGARIGLAEVAALGAAPVLVVLLAVGSTIACGYLLSRLLRRPVAEGLLSGGAVAICGASAALAISAVLPRSASNQRFTLITVVGVTTLSTLAMVVYPLIATWLALDAHEAAIFLGGAIHDVAQVVGAGFMISPAVGDGATLVKLLRVAMLLPVVVLFAHLFRATSSSAVDDPRSAQGKRSPLPPALPGFLLAFVALVALNSVGIVPGSVATGLGEVSRWCLIIAIAAIGVKTSFDQLADVGWQPVLMIVLESLWIAAVVLGSVLLMRGGGG
ncbi:MAG TPA: putative sulfate exporter family transporter [Burkholderiaceae bacterium]|nr:putative sulfate exporter family transporter [Burkholderiaceae bacterium]